jgi:hypothetical protein
MRGLTRGAGYWDRRSGSFVPRRQQNPLPQGACLAVRISVATHCSKDQRYLSGENCTHIARTDKVKIFLFIFSNLLRFCLRKIRLSRQCGPAAQPLDGGHPSAYF